MPVETIASELPQAPRSAGVAQPVAVAESSQRLLALARRVAASDCTVLISGESGTGKEVLARFIHDNSSRAARSFVAVNCAAIPESMLEALLFGYERGAFTGAHLSHAGKFEQAQGGTLLLDEISEMPLGLQAKLLRVLQEREVERLGGQGPLELDVRVLATTNKQLRSEVSAGRFREDLYYRLNVFPLQIAPLRERRDDILPLAMHLLEQRAGEHARLPALGADAAHALLAHSWPGNVRELDNVLQRALILCNGTDLDGAHVQIEPTPACAAPEALGGDGSIDGAREAGGAGVLAQLRERAEREVLLQALRAPDATRRSIAARLGISPRTLRYKLARMRADGVQVPAA